VFLGNDIVDLVQDEAREKHLDRRFLDRVFTPEERRAIRYSSTPSQLLWALWAGKEAFFKAARKAQPDLIFSPRRIQVVHGGRVPGGLGATSGKIVHLDAGLSAPTRWDWHPNRVHCISVIGPATDEGFVSRVRRLDEIVSVPLTAAETDSVYCPESAGVRILAHELLAPWQIEDLEIVRTRNGRDFGPPRVFSHGVPLDNVDLSLSHDGAWLAAAVAITSDRPAPRR
jgi:phosphopantetheinyl transferase (holo-ACP synthase)